MSGVVVRIFLIIRLLSAVIRVPTCPYTKVSHRSSCAFLSFPPSYLKGSTFPFHICV